MGDGSARRCPDGFLDREEALIEEQILVLQGIGEDGGTESRAGRGRHLSLSVSAPTTPSRVLCSLSPWGSIFLRAASGAQSTAVYSVDNSLLLNFLDPDL